MSAQGGVVDVMLDPADLKLSSEDFHSHVMEPALARLQKYLKLAPDTDLIHLRITARPYTQGEWDAMFPPEDSEQ